MKTFLRMSVVALIALGGKGAAHEFWIDPLSFAVDPGDEVQANLRVGEEFSGSAMSYLPRNFVRFDVISGDETRAVEGRLGDIPALAMGDLPDGLAIIVHETTENRLTWSDWERFAGFAEHKDLGDIAAMQAARGLDQEAVREGYTRYAKSLVAVGNGEGQDRRVGLRTEIVALMNPYTDDIPSRGLPVQVWLDDDLRTGVQVELFERAPDGEVTVTFYRTDASGIAYLPMTPGHVYLADAVVLEPADPGDGSDPEWTSLWASLTYQAP